MAARAKRLRAGQLFENDDEQNKWHIENIGGPFADAMNHRLLPKVLDTFPEEWTSVVELGDTRFNLNLDYKMYDEPYKKSMKKWDYLYITFDCSVKPTRYADEWTMSTPIRNVKVELAKKVDKFPDLVYVEAGRYPVYGLVDFDDLPSFLNEHASVGDMARWHQSSTCKRTREGHYKIKALFHGIHWYKRKVEEGYLVKKEGNTYKFYERSDEEYCTDSMEFPEKGEPRFKGTTPSGVMHYAEAELRKIPRKEKEGKERDLTQERHWLFLLKYCLTLKPGYTRGHEALAYYLENIEKQA